jgi:hypothetical protein
MKVALFESDLYIQNAGTSTKLSADMRALEKLRQAWSLDMAPRLFNTRSSVGTYDSHMKSIIFEESVSWTRQLRNFPDIFLAKDSPCRRGLVPRGKLLLAAMAEVFPVPDKPFWHAVAENVYGYPWCLLDNTSLCRECSKGACTAGVLASFPDYFHFLEELPLILDSCTQNVEEFITHVHQCHAADGPERKAMDAWMMCVQSVYLDVLHPKSNKLRFPDDELRSIRYRLINSAGRALALDARMEDHPIAGEDSTVDAVAFASTVMHDICDYRHDNTANEFYNLITIVSGHTKVPSVGMIRRFCVDVWAWALDRGELWAIRLAGRELAWQIYMARYQTSLLLDCLSPPSSPEATAFDPYGDQVLNGLNPLPQFEEPRNYDLRSRCQNKENYDRLLQECLTHFNSCDGCHRYDTASWEERVPLIGAAYQRKYEDCGCLNTISSYMILKSPDRLWWLAEPTAEYSGPKSDWSSLLC